MTVLMIPLTISIIRYDILPSVDREYYRVVSVRQFLSMNVSADVTNEDGLTALHQVSRALSARTRSVNPFLIPCPRPLS